MNGLTFANVTTGIIGMWEASEPNRYSFDFLFTSMFQGRFLYFCVWRLVFGATTQNFWQTNPNSSSNWFLSGIPGHTTPPPHSHIQLQNTYLSGYSPRAWRMQRQQIIMLKYTKSRSRLGNHHCSRRRRREFTSPSRDSGPNSAKTVRYEMPHLRTIFLAYTDWDLSRWR